MLTYADVPLLFPDPTGELDRWLKKLHPLDTTAIFSSRSLSELGTRRGLHAWHGARRGIGLTSANYPAIPQLGLNTLYWPTGATRWSAGLFLASHDSKDKLLSAGSGGASSHPLKMAAGKMEIEAEMFLLPPLPLGSQSPTADLWIVPLVDARYWWQYRSFGSSEVTYDTTWSQLFSNLGTLLGESIDLGSGVDTAYLQPDPIEFTRPYESAAAMLDAAALSVGKRIVRRLDGQVIAQSPAEATATLEENLKAGWPVVSGGAIDSSEIASPSKLTVTYRKWRDYIPLPEGEVFTQDHGGPSGAPPSSEVVIHSTAFANCTTSDTPSNSSELEGLTTAIGNDFFAWRSSRFDRVFSSIPPWKPTGFDNAVTWEFGPLCDGEYRVQTRVQSLPHDFRWDLQLSQSPNLKLLEPMQLGVTDEAIDVDEPGPVSIMHGPAGSESDTMLTVTATNKFANVAKNKVVALTNINGYWYLTAARC